MAALTISPEVLARASDHATSDEDLAGFLKGEGLSKSLSVIAFATVRKVPMAVAKSAIHLSRAWAGRRDADERLHSIVLDQLP